MPPFKPAIDATPIVGPDVRAAARLARGLGCEGVVVPARSPIADLTQLSTTGAREFLHVLASLGQRLAGVGHDLGPDGLSPRADLQREVEGLQASIRAAAAVGRATVLVDLGPLPPPPVAAPPPRQPITPEQAGLILLPEPSPEPPTPAPARDLPFESTLHAALREVASTADRNGVTVAFRASLAPLAALSAALHAVDCPWFGVDLDPLAVLMEDRDRHAVLSDLGSLVRHVRGRDGVRGAGQRTRAVVLGQGQVDWPAFAADLEAAGYRGFITIDVRDLPNPRAAAAAAVALLRPPASG